MSGLPSPFDDIAPDEMKICVRCGRKAGFAPDELSDGYVSDCCGFPAVDPTREPDDAPGSPQ